MEQPDTYQVRSEAITSSIQQNAQVCNASHSSPRPAVSNTLNQREQIADISRSEGPDFDLDVDDVGSIENEDEGADDPLESSNGNDELLTGQEYDIEQSIYDVHDRPPSDSDSDIHDITEYHSFFSLDIFEENVEDDDKDSSPTLLGLSLQETEATQESLDQHPIHDGLIQKATSVLERVQRSMNRGVLLACISLYGKVRYTLEHYEHLVEMMKDCETPTILPCSTTMRKFVFPRMIEKIFVRSSIQQFPTKSSFIPYLPTSSTLGNRQREAVVVLPSSWVRMDVRCLHVIREIACIENCCCVLNPGQSDLRINTSLHVTRREELTRNRDSLWVIKNGVPFSSSSGMIVKFFTADEHVVSKLRRSIREFQPETLRYRGDTCMAFKGEILSFIKIQFSSERGIYFDDVSGSGPLDDVTRSKYDSCIELLKKLSRRNHKPTYCDSEADENHSTRDHYRDRRPSNRVDGDDLYLVPSDHITLIRIEDSNDLGVYVSRFWVQRLDDERNFFVYVKSEGLSSEAEVCATVSTIGAPEFVTDQRTATSSPDETQCKTTGTLSNGKRYYMYRVILYADDFNPRSTLFPKGSVGGLYMMPTGFNVRSRRSQAVIRTVSVTPAGVSTNSVLDFLIEDLVNGCIEGIDCVDAFGEKVTVFLDIMGFIGDYPASSGVLDLKGHNATAPCTHCGFTFTKSPGSSMYAYTTSISSCHTAFRRSQWRSQSIRQAGLSSFQEKCLGLSVLDSNDIRTSTSFPLLKLACVHNDTLRSNTHSSPVELYVKDGYDLNLIAPDHLLTGLFKGILLIIFIQLPSDDAREKLQQYLRELLTEHGFQGHSVLYKRAKKKLVPGLSMSTLYCILTVLPVVLQSLHLLDSLPSKQLLINMHKFFTLAFWWPNLSTDGESAWHFVHGDGMNNYHRALQVLAANFVKSVAKFSKSYPSLAREVDLPNTHRLLELAYHTIPRFNHILYVCELVFESAHQPLKFFLSRNLTLNSHIYSVHLVLARDWLIRIWSLWSMYRDENESEKIRHHALIGLIRLFGGHEADDVQLSSPAVSHVVESIQSHIHKLMMGTVEKRMGKWYHDTELTHNSTASWVLSPIAKKSPFSNLQCRTYEAAISELSKLCQKERTKFLPCLKALLQRGFGSATKSSHERLHVGNIVQILLEPGFEHKTFLANFISSKGRPTFFLIGGFIEDVDGTNWALVENCTVLSPSSLGQMRDTKLSPFISVRTFSFYREDTSRQWHFLELSEKVRKVGFIHKCGSASSCDFTSRDTSITHSETTLGGGDFYILNSLLAYPPRRS